MGRWTRPHRGRAHNGRRGRDRIHRVFWTGDGDQYAGELPPPRVDAHSWRVRVAAMWSPAGGLSDWRPTLARSTAQPERSTAPRGGSVDRDIEERDVPAVIQSYFHQLAACGPGVW